MCQNNFILYRYPGSILHMCIEIEFAISAMSDIPHKLNVNRYGSHCTVLEAPPKVYVWMNVNEGLEIR